MALCRLATHHCRALQRQPGRSLERPPAESGGLLSHQCTSARPRAGTRHHRGFKKTSSRVCGRDRGALNRARDSGRELVPGRGAHRPEERPRLPRGEERYPPPPLPADEIARAEPDREHLARHRRLGWHAATGFSTPSRSMASRCPKGRPSRRSSGTTALRPS